MPTSRRGRSVDQTGRSKADGQYWKAPYAMLKSPAWRSLSGAAVKVYLELRTRFNGFNNGDLSLSYQEAVDSLHLAKATIHRAFCELEDRGFIRKTKQGYWYGRKATTWALTDQHFNGYLPTRDWQKWKPPDG